jgi:hypothetical protein
MIKNYVYSMEGIVNPIMKILSYKTLHPAEDFPVLESDDFSSIPVLEHQETLAGLLQDEFGIMLSPKHESSKIMEHIVYEGVDIQIHLIKPKPLRGFTVPHDDIMRVYEHKFILAGGEIRVEEVEKYIFNYFRKNLVFSHRKDC